MNSINKALRIIRQNAGRLTRQQVRTLRGQALAGDAQGAMRGLETILKRKG